MPDDTKKRASSKKATPVASPRAAAKASPAPKKAAPRTAAKAPASRAPKAKAAPAKKAAPKPAAPRPVAPKAAVPKTAAPKAAAPKTAAPKTAAPKAAAPKTAAPKTAAAKPAAKKPAVPKPAAPKAPAAKAAKPAKPAAPRKAAAKPAATPARPKAKAKPRLPAPPSAPDPDGFFVARVRGEDAVRDAPHPMLEGADWEDEAAPVAAFDEGLGELPWGYGDDTLVALPRDPRTLYLYWDHARETLQQAFAGLDHPRAQLWLFVRGAGWERIRVLDFALESRGYYLHDLEPGRVYRAEIHLVDRAGRERLVSQPSNPMGLPPIGPSPVVDDRFVRIPWEFPLPRLLGPGVPGGPFSEELRAMLARLSDWARFRAGPAGAAGAGGVGGRPTSPEGGFGRPTSPSSPFGPFGSSGEGGR